MYSVMIVEDELLVRMGLKVSIPWDSLNMYVTADISDGIVALEQFKKLQPNLVVTDIRMPGMDGLTLIREIRKLGSSCEIIIITCLEDFHTLHDAMKQNITGYLLKATMTQDEILATLGKAKEALDAKQANIKASGSKNSHERDLLALLQSFVAERSISCSKFLQRCGEIGVQAKLPEQLMMVNIRNNSGYKDLLYSSIKEILSGKLGSWEMKAFTDREYIIFLVYGKLDASQLQQRVAEINTYISENFNTSLLVALKTVDHGFDGIWEALDECKEIFANWQLNDEIFYCDSFLQSGKSEIAEWLQGLRALSWRYGFIYQPNRNKYDIMLDQLETALLERREYRDVLISLIDFMAKVSGHVPEEELSGLHQRIQQSRNSLEAKETFEQFVAIYSAFPKPNLHTKIICETIDYLQKNIQEDITLTAVASMANLSPNYFSSLFKQETGMSFTDFQSKLRIERAKYLLQTTSLMINEVSSQCGFSDIAYFSRYFKQITGTSPSAWRERA